MNRSPAFRTLDDVRAVFFDAVGTLIEPRPPVAEAYARLAREAGVLLPADEIERRFRTAFAKQEQEDLGRRGRTDEARERRRWTGIVGDVFFDQPNPLGAFEALWDHFARPESWACFDEVAGVLVALADRGFALGIASNFDARLRSVVKGLPALAPCRHVVISSEIGWRKPASAFFEQVCARGPWPARAVLFVGDDRANDFEAARAFGMQGLLLARRAGPDVGDVIRTLGALPRRLFS